MICSLHYYLGIEKRKVYLNAILELYDRRIVSFMVDDKNNNTLVFDTFDAVLESNPNACPIFHSDRGFQYTSRIFRSNRESAGMTQSMS
jgi:transposase InsO family protein